MRASTSDYIDIQRLVMAYSFAASARDADAVAATFAPDGVLAGFAKMLGRDEAETAGRDAIRAMFIGFLPGVELIHQMSQLGDVDVDGDTASATVMAMEYVRWRDQPLSLFVGYYHDRLVRTPDGWRYARRSLVPAALSTLPGQPTVF